MKNFVWLTPVVITALMILPGCNKNRDERAPSSESSSSAPANAPSAAMSDADLEKMIKAKIESDDALKQAKLSVSADVKENKATLSGTVVSQDMRAKAVDLAKSVQPGISIEDKIDVKPEA